MLHSLIVCEECLYVFEFCGRRLSADTMPDDPKTDGESAFALRDRSAQVDRKYVAENKTPKTLTQAST